MRLRRNSTDYLTLDSSGVTLASGLQLSLANSSGSPYYFNFNSLSNYLRINRSGTTYIEAAAQGAGQAGFLATPNTGGYAVFGSTNAYEVRLQRNATVYQTLDVNGTVFASGKNIGVGGTSPSTSGAGITFPATASISSDANTLDDYEEGSFTPAIIGTTTAGTGTYTFEGQTGGYTKIGRVVHVSLYLGWTAHTGTGDTAISGLPFIPVNSTSYKPRFSAACTGTLAITSGNNLQIYALGGNTTITIQQTNATNTTTTGITPVATTGAISVNLTYYTSS
jgi:hypothetical protein